jgi:putative peptidoglycan lipid II flippase
MTQPASTPHPESNPDSGQANPELVAGPQRTLSSVQIRRVSLMVAGSFLISAVLGMVRQAIIGGIFGASAILDSFYAAYRLPESIFALLAGGALVSAFIPVYSKYLGGEDESAAWALASSVMTFIGLITSVFSLAAFLFAPQLVSLILLPAAPPDQQLLTASLMRVMLLTVVIFSLSGLIMGILNAHHHYLAPALAPSMNNIGLIVGAVFLAPSLGVHGLAVGAVLGAVLHLAIQLPALRAVRPLLRFRIDFRSPEVGKIFALMLPRILGTAAVQIVFVVNTALTSEMAVGSLTALVVAFNLMFVTLGVLGQSVGTAIFPTLAMLAKYDMAGFRRTLIGAGRNVLFLALPASVGLFLLAKPLVATIYERGQWGAADTALAGLVLQMYALGLAAFSLQEVLARAFYAMEDTLTPVSIFVAGMVINVALSLALARAFAQSPTVVAYLALANALTTIIETVIMVWLLRRRSSGSSTEATRTRDSDFLALLKMATAALLMGVVVWAAREALASNPAPVVLLASTLAGLAAFTVLSLALRINETEAVIGRAGRIFAKMKRR